VTWAGPGRCWSCSRTSTGPTSSASRWSGTWPARLLPQRLAEEIRLPRLDPAQTAALAGALLGHPPPAGVAAAVHDRSDGIPLHVEELLAALPEAATGPDPGGVAAVPVPDTLADAVLAGPGGWTSPRWRWPGRAR